MFIRLDMSNTMNIGRVFVIGTVGFALVFMGLFFVLNSSLNEVDGIHHQQVEAELEKLEKALQSHRKTMDELDQLVQIAYQKSMDELDKLVRIADQQTDRKTKYNNIQNVAHTGTDFGVMSLFSKKDPKVCVAAFGIENEAKSDINMLGVYEELPFDNPDGGAWTQGWDVQIDASRFNDSNKLKIFLVPHSHNDPGWVKTFEAYYESQTKSILNSMLQKLSENPTLKFIWAEISFFSLWWDEISGEEKARVKKLISNKQLEFVTGGWVMPDESSPHYYAMLIQLIEGHQWLLHHLNYVPKNGWSIDPFGMSPTNAYLLKRTGLRNMVIQRTHYAVKKYLAQKQELEFKWRQNWDPHGTADMLCHLMPFFCYDAPHSCGPDPSVCCQFDFTRMPSVSEISCPWRGQPIPIIPQNVKTRAELLLDQYKKKAMLYKTNVLLVPLGGDFRWDSGREWDAQANNYGILFDFINSHPEYKAEAKFATLEDYFGALDREISTGNFDPKVLSGDFFTYADMNDHYWSGYFTSRPFHKASDRQLITLLQSAQLSFTLMVAEVSRKWGDPAGVQFIRNLMGKLIRSRRALSLFQHHDGIAGTSRDPVVVDYAVKLFTAMNDCNHVMQQSLQILTNLVDPELMVREIGDMTEFYKPMMSKDTHDELPHYSYLALDEKISLKIIKVLNPLARKRYKLVRVYVSTYKIQVADLEGNVIPHEVFPVFKSEFKISDDKFEVSFVADIDPISVRNYVIKYSSVFSPTAKPEILVINSPHSRIGHKLFHVNSMPDIMEPIQISNGYITVNFNENGFMKSATVNQTEVQAEIKFKSYGTQNRIREKSGLYLFFPDGDAIPVPVAKPMIRVVKGRLESYVEVWLTQVKHRITVYNHTGFERYAIEVKNLVDIRQERNFELSMNVKTNLESENVFYTDLNAFQMIKRKWQAKLPMQANFYPIPSAAFIQNKENRMTILSAQALGGASLRSGELEIMMDRRLMQDDDRGAAQGCLDNLETMHSFKILFESKTCEDSNASKSPPMLSLPAHLQLEDMLSPLQVFGTYHQSRADSMFGVADYTPSGQPGVSCDVQLLSTLPLPDYADSLDDHSYVVKPKSSLLFHRYGFDGRFGSIPLPECALESSKLGRFNVAQLFGGLLLKPKMQQATLSFLIKGKDFATNDSISMKPMEVDGFVVSFNVNSNS